MNPFCGDELSLHIKLKEGKVDAVRLAPRGCAISCSSASMMTELMEGKTLAIGAFNTKLDDNFEVLADSAAEAEKIRAGMVEVERRIEGDMDPVKAAAQRDVDEVVKPSEIRAYLEAAIAMSYQATGHRRIKNPRIWSLHDLSTLTG